MHMPKERSVEENILIMRNMTRLLENWDPDDSDEVSEAKMIPILQQIEAEAQEREAMKGVQDLSSTGAVN